MHKTAGFGSNNKQLTLPPVDMSTGGQAAVQWAPSPPDWRRCVEPPELRQAELTLCA
jgi:hypothetical protein